MRQPAIAIEPRPMLGVGQRVKFADTKRKWTVRGVTKAGRFAILTQPFNLNRTVLYTVVDFDRGVRGRDDHYGLGYETEADIADALHKFQHHEDASAVCDSRDCFGSAEVSHRSNNHIRLDFQSIDDAATDWTGNPTPTDTPTTPTTEASL